MSEKLPGRVSAIRSRFPWRPRAAIACQPSVEPLWREEDGLASVTIIVQERIVSLLSRLVLRFRRLLAITQLRSDLADLGWRMLAAKRHPRHQILAIANPPTSTGSKPISLISVVAGEIAFWSSPAIDTPSGSPARCAAWASPPEPIALKPRTRRAPGHQLRRGEAGAALRGDPVHQLVSVTARGRTMVAPGNALRTTSSPRPRARI
ncbi:hypothetical protein SAMN05519103_06493 [Rhizobiales bacterium GAS113]|nr:hypothetical protein SAMN05519103_06493 [Rhizobiales bacterium GAS113]